MSKTKRLLLPIFASVLIIATVGFVPTASAAPSSTPVSDATEKAINDAIRTQVEVQAMRDILRDDNSISSGKGLITFTSNDSVETFKKNPWNSALAGSVWQKEYLVGYAQESAIEGQGTQVGSIQATGYGFGGPDGAVKASTISFEKLAQDLGVTVNDLICNGSESGLFQRTNGGPCNDFSTAAQYKISPNAEAYLQELYNKRVAEAPDLLMSYDQLDSYNDGQKYTILKEAFEKDCGSFASGGNTVTTVSLSGQTQQQGVAYKSGKSGGSKTSDKMVKHLLGGASTCDDIISGMNDAAAGAAAYSRSEYEKQGGDPDNPGADDRLWEQEHREFTETAEDPCFDVSGVMGWIVCPVVFALQEAMRNIYEGYIVPTLQTNVDLFSTEDNSAAYQAWGIFRDAANVFFVIFLLIVIFSQVTGFGIDNYGIKRSLPKLIIAAILVNLSFFICQLAVDISNIIGSGANNLFVAIANSSISGGSPGSMGTNADVLVAAIGTGSAAGAAAGTAAAVSVGALSGWAIIIPVLLTLLSGVISVLFMFFLLAARQAIVVILVVISPLALVLYALPNTSKLSKRWLDVLKAMLMLYPICGAMIGGSYLASKILLAGAGSDSFLMNVVALLTSVVPFFFIPALVKSSMSAMGTLGGKLGNLGSRLSGGISGTAGRALRGTNMVRGSENRAAGVRENRLRRREAARGQKYVDKYNRAIANRGGADSAAGKRYAARHRDAAYSALRAQAAGSRYDTEAAAATSLAGQEALRVSEQKAAEKAALENQMTLVKSETANGSDVGKLKSEFKKAYDSGDKERARAIAEVAGQNKFSAKALSEYIRNGEVDKEGNIITPAFDGMDAGSAQEDVMKAVYKQMSAGENQKNYRSADALGFERAGQITRGENGASASASFGSWVSDSGNVKSAVQNHVTDYTELVSQGNSTMMTMYDKASDAEKAHLAGLAQEAMNAREKGISVDKTKDEGLSYILSKYNASSNPGGSIHGAASGTTGESFSTRVNATPVISQAPTSSAIAGPSRTSAATGGRMGARHLAGTSTADRARNAVENYKRQQQNGNHPGRI